MEQNHKLESMPMPRLILNMSLPLMVSLLVQALYNIVDGIFVAKLSEAAFTATSVAYPAQLLMIAVGVGTGVGVNALLSRGLGAKDETLVRQTAADGVVLALASAAVFLLLGVFCAGPFVRVFTDDAQIATYAGQYLSICMALSIGSLTATMFQRFLQASGDTFNSMLSLITGALTNLVLDPLFIFGIGFFPALEVRGAAIATVIGQWVSALTAIWLNRKKNPAVPVTLRGYRFHKEVVAEIYRVGLPTILTQAAGSAMVAAMNAILMPFSSAAVAFFGAYYKLQSFLFMPMNGLGQAAIPIIGYSFGAKRYERIRDAVRTVLPIGIGLSLLATLAFLLFPTALLGLFSPSAEMLEIGVPALRVISVSFAFASVTMILGYCMSGLGNGMVNMIGTALRQFLVLVPLAWVFSHAFGVQAVWYTIWIAELAAVLFAVTASRQILKTKGIA